MATPQPNPLPNIRTLAKDMAQRNRSKAIDVSTSSPAPKDTKPIPHSAFVDSSEKNIYQAPKEIKILTDKASKAERDDIKPKPVKTSADGITKPLAKSNLKSAPSDLKKTEPKIVVENEDAATATIIRDTKYNRFNLFSAISRSLRHWVKEIKETYFTKKKPKYTVPETNRRKGIIQEATSKTGKLTTFDRTSLQERIRQRQDKTLPKTPTTTWSANTEPGFLLLGEPQEKPVVSNVKVIPRKSFRSTPLEQKPVIATPLPPPIVVIPKPITPVTPVIEPPTVVTPIIETPVVTPVAPAQPNPAETVPVPTRPTESTSIPYIRTLASEKIASKPNTNLRKDVTTATPNQTVRITKLNPINLREWLFSLNTNSISLGIVGLLIAVLVAGLSGYLWFNGHSQITLTVTPNYPVLLSVPLQTIFINDLTKDNLFTQIIQNQKQSKYETLQIGLISSPEGENLLPPVEILNLIDKNIGVVFAHSIKTIYFGSINKTTPFVVMKTTDIDTARGGLLAWEVGLKDNLLPLFSIFNPSLAATSISEELNFKDIVVSGNDARVLTTEDNIPILIYSLTKQNILIITTDQKTLTELFTLIPKSS